MPEEIPDRAVSQADAPPGFVPVILLVEDEEPIRELIGMALSGRGYQVHTCAESERAMEMAATLPAPPHLLITDIHMQGLSGPELAAKMVAHYPELRILFVTGYASTSEHVRPALEFANAGFLRKPFSLAEFREQVEKVVQELRAAPARLAGSA